VLDSGPRGFSGGDDANEGTLHYNGALDAAADSVFLRLYAVDALVRTETATPAADMSYSFAIKLKPELINYRVEFGTRLGGMEARFSWNAARLIRRPLPGNRWPLCRSGRMVPSISATRRHHLIGHGCAGSALSEGPEALSGSEFTSGGRLWERVRDALLSAWTSLTIVNGVLGAFPLASTAPPALFGQGAFMWKCKYFRIGNESAHAIQLITCRLPLVKHG